MAKTVNRTHADARQRGARGDCCNAAALWRLVGSGTATYLSYWSLYFALQRAFTGR
jgi:hypothetical protein